MAEFVDPGTHDAVVGYPLLRWTVPPRAILSAVAHSAAMLVRELKSGGLRRPANQLKYGGLDLIYAQFFQPVPLSDFPECGGSLGSWQCEVRPVIAYREPISQCLDYMYENLTEKSDVDRCNAYVGSAYDLVRDLVFRGYKVEIKLPESLPELKFVRARLEIVRLRDSVRRIAATPFATRSKTAKLQAEHRGDSHLLPLQIELPGDCPWLSSRQLQILNDLNSFITTHFQNRGGYTPFGGLMQHLEGIWTTSTPSVDELRASGFSDDDAAIVCTQLCQMLDEIREFNLECDEVMAGVIREVSCSTRNGTLEVTLMMRNLLEELGYPPTSKLPEDFDLPGVPEIEELADLVERVINDLSEFESSGVPWPISHLDPIRRKLFRIIKRHPNVMAEPEVLSWTRRDAKESKATNVRARTTPAIVWSDGVNIPPDVKKVVEAIALESTKPKKDWRSEQKVAENLCSDDKKRANSCLTRMRRFIKKRQLIMPRLK